MNTEASKIILSFFLVVTIIVVLTSVIALFLFRKVPDPKTYNYRKDWKLKIFCFVFNALCVAGLYWVFKIIYIVAPMLFPAYFI